MSRTFILLLLCVIATARAFVAPSQRTSFSKTAPITTTLLKAGEEGALGGLDIPAAVESVAQSVDVSTVVETAKQASGGLDLDVVSLVVGQETYGLAIVCVLEALYSFLQAPSFGNAKVLIPAGIAAIVLGAVAGPMVTSGDADSVSTGLVIATVVSLGLEASYILRMLAPYSPAPKEIAFLGLLVSVAGFFSFSQNLLVDGFIVLPSLPSIPLPQIEFPTLDLEF